MATVMFDPSTGVTTSIGDTGDRFTGLAFDSAGILYAVTGDGAGVLETEQEGAVENDRPAHSC